jgi:hypothetical protein
MCCCVVYVYNDELHAMVRESLALIQLRHQQKIALKEITGRA